MLPYTWPQKTFGLQDLQAIKLDVHVDRQHKVDISVTKQSYT